MVAARSLLNCTGTGTGKQTKVDLDWCRLERCQSHGDIEAFSLFVLVLEDPQALVSTSLSGFNSH